MGQEQGKAWLSITNGGYQFQQKFSLTFGCDRHRQFKNKSQLLTTFRDRDCHFYCDFYLDFYHLSIKKGLLTLFKGSIVKKWRRNGKIMTIWKITTIHWSTEIQRVLLSDHCSTSKPPRLDDVLIIVTSFIYEYTQYFKSFFSPCCCMSDYGFVSMVLFSLLILFHTVGWAS